MIVHAQKHHEGGYPLPTRWAGVTDTFQSHKLKTIRSLQAPGWGGLWRFRDDYHVAECVLDGTVLVHLDLFGIEDQGAMDRLRMEMHGLWFEEPAPASVMVQSSGVNEGAWLMGLTSQRLATYHHPAIMTLNYPDEDHWTWKRFVVDAVEGTDYVRIPPGERASAADRAEWAKALATRPDMLRRLLAGEPGVLSLGPEVAVGFNPVLHVAREHLAVQPHAELWFGEDSAPNAHTHATIIGQRIGHFIRIYAGLVSEGGLKQHLDNEVLPWLERRAPWALQTGAQERLLHRHDPVMDTDEGGDIDQNPVKRIKRALGGSFRPGAVSWAGRLGPILSVFNMAAGGQPVLQIDPGPDTDLLRKALSGRWYYPRNAAGTVTRDLPAKPNHPWEDLGDAFCYLIGGMAPSKEPHPKGWKPAASKTTFSPWQHVGAPKGKTKTDFAVFR